MENIKYWEMREAGDKFFNDIKEVCNKNQIKKWILEKKEEDSVEIVFSGYDTNFKELIIYNTYFIKQNGTHKSYTIKYYSLFGFVEIWNNCESIQLQIKENIKNKISEEITNLITYVKC